ncbi:hypothetical protein J5N97_019412 [Dioscorea zingiberensis]|uniref:HSF-type DNA-binding domain-containing protein n=1 Tax=Dioscorea zingiberensis TaxID=325984 RepID=A0A9D5CEW1_9LILI|nr:hypothetical protein J5N97_019412 [Dioscorea zingiberensis]
MAAAPFVMKTYKMVDDPATDMVISWGVENNSFVVLDPFAFSQTLLPAHFKHSNFSSFVRQLNTYGFRKVDPDKWEFAHASFLRGQTHLLSNIVRRNSNNNNNGKRKLQGEYFCEEDQDEEEKVAVAVEVVKLKQAQHDTDQEIHRMWARLRDAERKPKQMLGFLVRVLKNPLLLDRLMAHRAGEQIQEKRARLRIDAGSDDGSGSFLDLDHDDVAPFFGGPEPIVYHDFGIGTEVVGVGAGDQEAHQPFAFTVTNGV